MKEQSKISDDFEKLENIIADMDGDDISLEDSFALYEDGMKLLKSLSCRIDEVEERVKLLNEDGSLGDLDE